MSLAPTPSMALAPTPSMALAPTANGCPGPPSVALAPSPEAKKWIESEPLTGELNMDKANFGKFLGKGGSSLRKYVTGKSSFKVKEAYARDKTSNDEKTAPIDLGPVFVNVSLDDSGENITFKITIRNANEDLTKYLGIVKANLLKHSSNCSIVKSKEDTFTHKMVFSAGMGHEGCIGKFIGGGGKNIRSLCEKLKGALNVSFVYVTMVPAAGADMKKKPWGNQVLSIDTPVECNFAVNVFVCANLPRDADFRSIMSSVVPMISGAIESANPRPSKEVETVSASEFMPGWSDFRPESPAYTPGSPDAGW
jgi:predicted RNA-binding protein YlqC (UPF0109 family)